MPSAAVELRQKELAIHVPSQNGSLSYSAAFKVALDTGKSVKNGHSKAELPAIVSHWLLQRSSKELPIRKTPDGPPKIILRQRIVGPRKIWVPQEQRFVDYTLDELPFLARKSEFTFIDLFAGIGGFRIALQTQGGKCVFSVEWNRAAKETYFRNFGEYPFGDIKQFTNSSISDEQLAAFIPDHDILAAGFPCQPFSRAGVSARNSLGQKHGFDCEEQGNLFFDIVRIAASKRPPVLFLENVKNLKSHDGGRTFKKIKDTIEKELDYSFFEATIDASPLVPQRRKRCYMVCFRDKTIEFSFPKISGDPLPLGRYLEEPQSDWFTLSDAMWEGHKKRTARNVARGTGFTAYTADLKRPANTLVSRYWKDGKECLIPQPGKNPRLLTPRECARLQGFPEEFRLPSSPNAAYRQFGNSVAVPVVEEIVKKIKKSW